ncbi:MAG: hypothetical protein EXQ53_12955 [Acidobacteria bacterium]|nr:hypothetical protein [Acidobacteriota bacterium]
MQLPCRPHVRGRRRELEAPHAPIVVDGHQLAAVAATEGVTTPLAELEAAGRADLARNQQALREACAECAPGAGAPGASATGRAARRGVSIPVCAA